MYVSYELQTTGLTLIKFSGNLQINPADNPMNFGIDRMNRNLSGAGAGH